MYLPEQNIAMKVNYEEPESAIDEVQSITDYNPEIIGTETVDGKVCKVVKYTEITVQIHDVSTFITMWIWKDKGFPIRVEM